MTKTGTEATKLSLFAHYYLLYYYKTLLTNFKDLYKWRHISFSWKGRLNIVNVNCPKTKFNAFNKKMVVKRIVLSDAKTYCKAMVI